MFDFTHMHEIRYHGENTLRSFAGVQLHAAAPIPEESLRHSQIFLKDCQFTLYGVCHACPYYPISPLAREHFLYIQSFSYWKAGAGCSTLRRNLDSYLLLLTYGGAGQLDYEGKTYSLQKGVLSLIDCRKPHHYQTVGDGWEYAALHFNGTPAAPLYQEFLQKNGSSVFLLLSDSAVHSHMQKLLECYISGASLREYAVSAALTELLLQILDASPAVPRHMSRADQMQEIALYIGMHYFEELSLNALSKRFSISKYHLCRSFKAYAGQTLFSYITALRLEQSKELLRSTPLSAAQISALVGIKDENYFYRLFKKHTGVSPHLFRKQGL